MSMSLIQTVTVSGTTTSTVTFSSIPQDGTDLVLLVSARSSTTDPNLTMTFNGVSTTYSGRAFGGTGSTAFSENVSVNLDSSATPSTYTANTFGNSQVLICNYAETTVKRMSLDSVQENNATSSVQRLAALSWSGTSAITLLSVTSAAGATLVAGSTFSLYKITKGSGGATVS